MRRQKQIPISSFLHPKTKIINKSISLASNGINILDELDHYVCGEIESLDLSCNKLTSLKGIEQFTALKQLNIADNKVARCQELEYLGQLLELKKLYLGNNPFLNQPINENILDFILDKETDIEILSFQVLSSLKDVEEREMKIIFLKNYILKIDIHSQLKDRTRVIAQQPAMRPEEVIKKIVPQFYTIIQDPKIANRIKKEAIGKRKSSHESIQEVLQVQKQEKEKLINHLIKDIVSLLHQSQEFKKSRSFMLQVNLNENTVTFSPERRELSYKMDNLSEDYSPVRHIEASKDEASIQELTLSNQKLSNTQAFLKGSNKPLSSTQPSHFLKSSEKKHYTPTPDFDTLETARKNTPGHSIQEKLKQHTYFKMNYQSQIKRIREREHQNQQKMQRFDRNSQSIKRQSESPKGFQVSKFKRNLQSPKKKIQYIKVIEQNLQQSQENNKQIVLQIPNNYTKDFLSPRNIGFSNVTARYSTITSEQLTPQAVQTLYFKTLIKTNPMFTLLHSPATSLKSEEKSQLLEALKQDHRERYIELFKERHNNQQLMRELQRMGLEHNKQVQTIIQNNKSIYNQYILYKEEIEWAEERRRAIQQQYDQIAQLYRISQANEKKKGTALSILQNNYKKLRQAYGEKNQRVDFLENCIQKEESIREIRQKNILKAYLQKIKQKAIFWDKFLKLQKQTKKKNDNNLIKIAFLGLKLHKQHEDKLKKLCSKIDNTIVKYQFLDWKDITAYQRKVRQIDFIFLKKRCGQSIRLLKANEAVSKMKKLKMIWSDRFLKEHLHKKSMIAWKKVMVQLRVKNEKASRFRVQYSKKSIIYSLLTIMKNRKEYIQTINEKRTERLFISQFKRMIFLMNKQKMEIQQKYREVGKNLEFLRKKEGLRLLIERTKRSTRFKQIKRILDNQLSSKNIKVFKKAYKNDRGLQKRLKKILWKIKKQLSFKILNRQRLSNYLSQSLHKQRIVSFITPLKQYHRRQFLFHSSASQLNNYFIFKSVLSKVRFLKTLQVLKLKGKNYIKKRKLQQMQHQMDLNDLNALDLVKAEKDEISKRDKQIIFLKNQIQSLAMRQAVLLQEKDETMLSIQESYEIMVELRSEVDNLRFEYAEQERKYNAMVGLYNQTLNSLDEKERECLKLYSKVRQSIK